MEIVKKGEVAEAVELSAELAHCGMTSVQVNRFDVRIPGWPRQVRHYQETLRLRHISLMAGARLVEESMEVARVGQSPTLSTTVYELTLAGQPEPLRYNEHSLELPHRGLLAMLQLAHANIPVIHPNQQDRTG